MLMPKKVKYRKQHRGRMTGKAWRGSTVSFGDYGLKALEPCWMTDRQIEAARVAMTRFIKRGGKIWVRVFPAKPITNKMLKMQLPTTLPTAMSRSPLRMAINDVATSGSPVPAATTVNAKTREGNDCIISTSRCERKGACAT